MFARDKPRNALEDEAVEMLELLSRVPMPEVRTPTSQERIQALDHHDGRQPDAREWRELPDPVPRRCNRRL